jgi:anthranilate synthase/indole-3-glycerol phosphate synthase/phosphoribosylanthranilate isomerase
MSQGRLSARGLPPHSSLVMSLPEHLARPLDVLMIDNFDSFTWNLYQHLILLGADVHVIRNDAINTDALPLLQIRALIISPGPGHPHTDSGLSRDAIRYFTGRVPVLGVCMGLECLVDVYGGEIRYTTRHSTRDPAFALISSHPILQLCR